MADYVIAGSGINALVAASLLARLAELLAAPERRTDLIAIPVRRDDRRPGPRRDRHRV